MPGLPGALLAAALALLGLASAWSRALLRASASVRAMELGGEELLLELTDGRRIEAQASARRYVTRFMVAIPVRRPMRRTILVTHGMMSPEGFRRLRIWALWGKVPSPVAGRQLPA